MTNEDRAGLPEPMRENLVRALPGASVSGEPADGRLGTLYGRLANYNQWAEVRSSVEGHFMERVLPGAFTRTFNNNRSRMQVIYDHGQDQQIGRMPLGPLEDVIDGPEFIDYSAGLIDAPYNQRLLPGLRAGLFGNSFRFNIPRGGDDWNYKPARSEHNPDGIPEHTVREAKIIELGPTPFPVYDGTPAGVRSMTDEYLVRTLSTDPDRLATLLRSLPEQPAEAPEEPAAAPSDPGPEATHSEDEARVEPPPDPPPPDAAADTQDPPEGGSSDSKETPVDTTEDKVTRADRPARIKELAGLVRSFSDTHDGTLNVAEKQEWDGLTSELEALRKAEDEDARRRSFIAALGDDATRTEDTDAPTRSAAYPVPNIKPAERVRDIYSFAEIRNASRNAEDERQLLQDSAMRAIEGAAFPHMDKATGQGAVEKTLKTAEENERTQYVEKRILLTGNPTYRRALHKTLMGQMLNVPELTAYSEFQEFERAMGQVTGSAGGFGVTFDLDPTMVQTSNGAIVPYRRAARVVSVTTNEWRGVTSGGVVASYAAEAAVGTDNSPTLAQPAALVQKAHCFVPFSMELQGDYQGLEAELGREIQDAKDVLEAVQFTTGAGTTVFPQGIVTGSTTASNLATTGVLAAADLYTAEMTLAPRFRVRAHWFANRMFYNKIRAIDTAGGAQLWTQNLTYGLTNDFEGNTGYKLLGYPANEASGFTTTFTGASNKVAVFGDPNYFVIVDRVGLNLELVPILTQQATAGTGFGIPTGQRGVYAWWRNTSKVLSASAFLTVTTV
jgi:HK97 family phage major capsid protein